jgi:hypothetical protein
MNLRKIAVLFVKNERLFIVSTLLFKVREDYFATGHVRLFDRVLCTCKW